MPIDPTAVHALAPLRISFVGGGTDFPHWYLDHGSAVLSATIDHFVRVRLTRIDEYDLNLFEFDLDLTFFVFFLNAENKVYARYGGRDAQSADSRHSLDGLRYTMESVLAMHEREAKQFAPRTDTQRLFARDVTGWYGGGCMHCHQVKEAMHDKLKREGNWKRTDAWRYPLPENVGVRLETDRGNVVEEILPESAAELAGLAAGDVIQSLGSIPIHSFADAQFALDKAPAQGTLAVTWLRGGEPHAATLSLAYEWKKSDLDWRASVRWRLIPSLPLSGEDLTADEREELALADKQLAFRSARLKTRAKEAGFQDGDIVVAIDDRTPDMTVTEFRAFIRHEFLVGDTITLTVLRNGESLKIPLTLSNP